MPDIDSAADKNAVMPEDAQKRIQAAYDPQLFQEAATTVVEKLAARLESAYAGNGPVLNWKPPVENFHLADSILTNGSAWPVSKREIIDRLHECANAVLENGHNLHNPRYIGHQVPASIPVAGLFSFVSTVLNQVMAVYEMGPFITGVEQAVINQLAARIGWKPGEFSGLATNGGSIANLTALQTARNHALPDCWQNGVQNTAMKDAVIVAHADSHYCVPRSAGILGLGTSNVVKAPLDSRRRIDPKQLDELLDSLVHQKKTVIAVCACACATPIGAFDSIPEIADVCEKHDVWLHVDAAHGGATLFSEKHRHLLDGLDRADSFIWDAHKMLFVPAMCAFVFYRNPQHRFVTFQQDAPYLFDPTAPDLAKVDSGLSTFECTKQALALPLWGIWSTFGDQIFTDIVDTTFATCRQLYEKLIEAEDFQPFHEPQANILAFQYRPKSLVESAPKKIGEFNFAVRRRIIESGRFYIVPFQLDGEGGIRTTVMNPMTTEAELDALIAEIRATGETLLAT